MMHSDPVAVNTRREFLGTPLEATVENQDRFRAERILRHRSNGTVVASEIVTLDGRTSGTAEFAYSPAATGEYALTVDDVAGGPGPLTVGGDDSGSIP